MPWHGRRPTAAHNEREIGFVQPEIASGEREFRDVGDLTRVGIAGGIRQKRRHWMVGLRGDRHPGAWKREDSQTEAASTILAGRRWIRFFVTAGLLTSCLETQGQDPADLEAEEQKRQNMQNSPQGFLRRAVAPWTIYSDLKLASQERARNWWLPKEYTL